MDREKVVLLFLSENVNHLFRVFELNYFIIEVIEGDSCVGTPIFDIQNIDKVTPHQFFKDKSPISFFQKHSALLSLLDSQVNNFILLSSCRRESWL